jgi:hypothetical protein
MSIGKLASTIDYIVSSTENTRNTVVNTALQIESVASPINNTAMSIDRIVGPIG